ncbi:MAG: SpoIIE family protein phosphatase [Oscillospiraceae bacterium]|nr:SpoIIE family protein phosphatase [Oscillospiraceae bacterium]
MKVKEKNKAASAAVIPKKEERGIYGASGFFVSALLGFLAAGTEMGGGAPLCASAAAVLSPVCGFAAFGGAMVSFLLGGEVGQHVTEIIAVPAAVLSKALAESLSGRRLPPAASGLLAGFAYFICGGIAAFSYKATGALLMALAFRGVLAGISAFFMGKTLSQAEKNGFCITEENRVSAAVTYVLLICMACGVSFGALNAGRAAGAFFTVIAAYRLGCGAGAAVAALTAFAAGAASAGLLPSSAVLVCAGLAAGIPRKNGRYVSAAAFVGLGLAGALIYGMPRDTVNLLWDMLAAAGVFCLLPDKVYRMSALRPDVKSSAAVGIQSSRFRFAAAVVSDVRESFEKTWQLLDRGAPENHMDAAAVSMREASSEQLLGVEKMLEFLSGAKDVFPACDQELSMRVCEIFSEAGAVSPSAAVFFDGDGRLYIECFCRGNLNISNRKLTEKLSVISERELDLPEVFSADNTKHLCFHELTVFSAEIGQASVNGREDTSGDSGIVFNDGFGNVAVLISDGMGSGARAAVESCMTVSLMTKIMRAGLGAETAVRLINLMLMAKSPEECFSTVDLMTVNLFTGKTELLKLGAAQSFIKTGGTVKTVEGRSTPVGIVSSVEISRFGARLSDGDEIVMMTDGICEDIFPHVRELMLSVGVTAQDCAERVIAAAEKEKETSPYRQDDKTVYVVKIHKI